MRKKVCCILMLITLLLNSSVMLVISQAVDAVQNIVNKDKTKVFAEVNLTKYENYDTTTENSSTGSKGTLAQFNLKTGINFEEGENYTPIKKTSVNIEVPKIGNYNPTRVEVITKSTKATNGGKDAKYEYNSNTGILQITAENNDYTENVSEARDEYEIICIYKSECYTKDEKRNLNVKANVEETLKDDSETKISAKVEQKFEVQENVNGVISIGHEANNLYDGYIKANTLNSENKYETLYKETAKIMISNKDVAQKIEVKEVSEDSLYTDSIIDKNEVLKMLGEKGSIDILDEEGKTVLTINKDTEADENGKIKITYRNRTTTFYLRINNVEKEGIIEIENSRVILSTAQIDNNVVETQVSIKGINTIEENSSDVVKYERNEISNAQIKQAVSTIETTLSNNSWVNNTTNEVVLTETLKTSGPQNSLFKNPIINIEMPSEVEDVTVENAQVMYSNQELAVKSAKIIANADGNKVVSVQIDGEQTSYEDLAVVEGTNIRISLKVTVAKDIENKVEKLKTTYSNEMTGTTESNEIEVTLLNKVVNIVPEFNVQAVAKNEETTQVQSGVKVDVTETVGKVNIQNNGNVYEKQIVKQNIKVSNTEDVDKKVKVIVNVPDEMVYVKKVDDDGFTYHEDKNYYEFSKRYEFVEQKEKQITVEFDVKAGEIKTDFIELKVKDLADGEQEKQTAINYTVQVNEQTANQFTINNTVKKAEISVFVQPAVGKTRREWVFGVTIVNLTDKELKNINVAFEASEYFNLNEVTVNDDEETNVSGNIWTHTIESLPVTKLNDEGKYIQGEEYYVLMGELKDYDESKSREYEMNGVATVYGDSIATYGSNEARMKGYVEAVNVDMSVDKTELKMDDEVTYTVNIKNIGKTWGGFATYTNVDIQDVIPRELEPISATYNKFNMKFETITDEYGFKFDSQTYTESQETIDLSNLDIPEGYDEEDAPNIDLQLQIPEGKTVTMIIKAKARMITDTKQITNTLTAKGDWIKEKDASAVTKILKYDYEDNNTDPDNPNNPDNPSNPSNPDNPSNPNNPSTPTEEKVTISGTAWIDENEDGKRTTDEKTLSGITVMLYNAKKNEFVKENNQIKKIQTDSEGKYSFENVEKGQYIVLFLYDTNNYSLTAYQKEGVIETKNSDAVTKNVAINGEKMTAGLTNTLTANENLENIDIGLVENKKFDLEIQKYISKITVQTKDGKTKTYDYDNKQFAKVEIRSKQMNGATVIVEYKMLVTNNGELAGKAAQIVDKLPDGMTFKSELNSDWYEKDGSLYTNSLSGQNIQAGESKEVTLVLTKTMNANNVGTTTNVATIGISSNDKAIEDENSDNNTSQAQVLIGVSTGLAGKIGITIGTLAVLVGLAILIWKNRKILKAALFVSVLAVCLVGTMNPVQANRTYEEQLTIEPGLRQPGKLYIIGTGSSNHSEIGIGAYGSDGKRYNCTNRLDRFCSQHWHEATLESETTEIKRKGTWSISDEEFKNATLKLTDKTDKDNVTITKVDDKTNKIGPFNVESSYAKASHSVVVTYKGSDGKNATTNGELMNFGWGNDFYIKIPNTVEQVVKVTISGSYQLKRTKTDEILTTKIYRTYPMSTDSYCMVYKNQLQHMSIVEPGKIPYEEKIKRTDKVDINGPWSSTGNLEIEKVNTNSTAMKNVEFKISVGTDTNKSMVIVKDGKTIDKITVEKDITFEEGAGSYSKGKVVNATIDGVTGYKVQFNSTLDKATAIATNSEGKILIKNILCGKYTVTEANNNNYGYTKIASPTKSEVKPSETTPVKIVNEPQVGELNIKKIDDRVDSKVLPGVEFVLSSSDKKQYLRVKATGDNVTKDSNGWATKAVGTVTIDDTSDMTNNPVIEYTSKIDEATRFVTDIKAELKIKNLLISSNGKDVIKYKLEEVANTNYGYLADTGDYKNYKVTYSGNGVSNDGWITIDKKSGTTITIKNHQEYIRIEGYVWEEMTNSKDNSINNVYDKDLDALIEGLKVYLYKDDQVVAQTTTNSDGWYGFGTRKKDGEAYTSKDYLTVSNGDLKIDDLSKYHVEFEYDGLRFTSIKSIKDYLANNYDNTSKATEVPSGRNDRKDRASVNEDFTTVSRDTARNSSDQKTYDLSYDFVDHVSTYKDKWGYSYNDNKTKLKVTPAAKSEYAVIASTSQTGFKLDEAWNARCKNKGSDTLTGINLGIHRRDQADLAISSDLTEMNIAVNNGQNVYNNTYTYAKRTSEENTDNFGVEVKFGTGIGSYSSRGLNIYTRRIYESDLALENLKPGSMQIYVTYKMRVKNQSTVLNAKVKELANYYDARYEVADSWIADSKGNKTGSATWGDSKYGRAKVSEVYKAAYTTALANTEILPGEYVDVYIKFKLNNDAVKALIQKQTTLNNVSEINAFSSISSGKAYAAIDDDSNPGSVEIKLQNDGTTTATKLNGRNYEIENKTLDMTTFEDDTDSAPSLVLGIQEAEPTRGLSGTVFEDSNINGDKTNTGKERIGDGIFQDKENKVANAKVELLNENGEVVKLYEISSANGVEITQTKDASTTTDANGEYKFLGVLPGRYLIRYTYDSNTTINGKAIDPREYKSTIISSDVIKNALKLGQADERKGNYNWIIPYEGKRYSDAADDLNKRTQQEQNGVYNGNINTSDSMTADTAYFDVGVEYSEVKENSGFNQKVSYTDYKDEYNLDNGKIVVIKDGKIVLADTFYAVNPYQDFGIIERPRQQFETNKRISNIKVTLANGQVLINGNPYKTIPDAELYDRWSEIEKTADNALPYVKALPSSVLAEIDNELLQGATLEVEYTVSIKNDSELDYEYTTNSDYYYYGTKLPGQELKRVIKKVVDYMDDNLVYDENNNSAAGWNKVTADQLSAWQEGDITKKLVSDEVKADINKGYTISITDQFARNELKAGEATSIKIYGSKLLASNENGIGASNHVEIVETARKIYGATPGNYDPKTATPNKPYESDDDMTRVNITPPTGLTDNRTFIISLAAIVLVVVVGEIYFIKKKVLK